MTEPDYPTPEQLPELYTPTFSQLGLLSALQIAALPSVYGAFLANDVEKDLSTLVDRGYIDHDTRRGYYFISERGKKALAA